MTQTEMQIETSAEVLENAALPRTREVHTDPNAPCVSDSNLPKALSEWWQRLGVCVPPG